MHTPNLPVYGTGSPGRTQRHSIQHAMRRSLLVSQDDGPLIGMYRGSKESYGDDIGFM